MENVYNLSFALFLLGGILIWLIVIFFAMGKIIRAKDKSIISFIQSFVQVNAGFLGIPIALLLFDANSIAKYLIVLMIFSPMSTIVSVLLLSIFGEKRTAKKCFTIVVKSLFQNPIIMSCLLGVLINISGMTIPSFIDKSIYTIGNSSSALALLVVGFAFNLEHFKTEKLKVICASVTKLFVVPIVVIFACIFFNIDKENAKILVFYASLPTAITSYLVSCQLGGDSNVVIKVITLTTVLSVFTIPLFFVISEAVF
jgi:predicted permease